MPLELNNAGFSDDDHEADDGREVSFFGDRAVSGILPAYDPILCKCDPLALKVVMCCDDFGD